MDKAIFVIADKKKAPPPDARARPNENINRKKYSRNKYSAPKRGIVFDCTVCVRDECVRDKCRAMFSAQSMP